MRAPSGAICGSATHTKENRSVSAIGRRSAPDGAAAGIATHTPATRMGRLSRRSRARSELDISAPFKCKTDLPPLESGSQGDDAHAAIGKGEERDARLELEPGGAGRARVDHQPPPKLLQQRAMGVPVDLDIRIVACDERLRCRGAELMAVTHVNALPDELGVE